MPALFPNSMPADADLGVARNFASGVLAAAVDASTTTWTLASAGPVAGEYLVCDSEIVRVASAAGATLTVVRAQDGTSAASHTNGTAVYGNHVALHHNQTRLELLAALAELQRTNNLAMSGLGEAYTLIKQHAVNIGEMTANANATTAGVTELLAILADNATLFDFAAAVNNNNAIVGTITELITRLANVPASLWAVGNESDGGMRFPLSVRIDGRTRMAVPASAPSDADIPNGYMAPWYNEATGRLTFRIRTSAGILATKELA